MRLTSFTCVGREEVPEVPDCSSTLLAGHPPPFPASAYISDMGPLEALSTQGLDAESKEGHRLASSRIDVNSTIKPVLKLVLGILRGLIDVWNDFLIGGWIRMDMQAQAHLRILGEAGCGDLQLSQKLEAGQQYDMPLARNMEGVCKHTLPLYCWSRKDILGIPAWRSSLCGVVCLPPCCCCAGAASAVPASPLLASALLLFALSWSQRMQTPETCTCRSHQLFPI